MSDFDNTNRGALFKNTKRTNDKAPEYNGSLNVDGTDYWISGWIKESKDGNKFFSLSVQPKDGASKPAPKSKPKQEDFDDCDVPF